MARGSGSGGDVPDSLGAALAVLGALLHGDARGKTFPALQLATGMQADALRDLLERLEQLELIEMSDRRYHLGVRLFEFGGAAPISRSLREAAMPFIGDLYEVSGETVHFGILTGIEVLYIEKLRGHRPTPVPTRVGLRMPASCTGLGKAMLAFASDEVISEVLATGLPQRTPASITSADAFREELRMIATTGVAFDREENEIGVTCIAAPVFGGNPRAIAALSITGPTSRFDPTTYEAAIRTAAKGLSAVLSAT